MKIEGITAIVTGGASGLGLATARRLHDEGAFVLIIDLPTSSGAELVMNMGDRAAFCPADVTSESQVEEALDMAQRFGPIRALVHCAGRSGPLRIVDRDGNPGSQHLFEQVVRTNVFGTFNVLRLTAARMVAASLDEDEVGVCVTTASIAAFEGQIGQLPYATSKAAVAGMTLVAARDLARQRIRVCSIAPGIFDTPMMARVKEEARVSLAASVPHPARFGDADEFAMLAQHIIENSMLNGETIRLDGAIRMPPR